MADLIYAEAELFVVCLLLGAVLALVYDGVRIFRMLIPHKEIVVDIEDLAFWMFTAWMVFRTLFYYNRGALRGYAFLGMLLGVLIYMLTISRILMFLADKIVPCWKKGVGLVVRPIVSMKRSVIKTLKKALAEVKMAVKSR